MTEKLDFKKMRRSDDPSTKAAGDANLAFWLDTKRELGPLLEKAVATAPTGEDGARFSAWLKELEKNCEY